MDKSLSPTRADRLLEAFQHTASTVRKAGGSRQLIEDEHFTGDVITLQGQKLGNFGLCSYLGLGEDPRLREGAHKAIDAYGTSFSSSLAFQGIPLYRDLRERFEAIFGAKVVIAPTTTLAHFSAMPVLVRPGDVVYVDTQAHASVLSATQILQAGGIPVTAFRHGDLAAIKTILQEAEGEGRIWLMVDGVYSMSGDTAPAEELTAFLEKYPRLHIYCDDAHGFGWDGRFGSGQYLRRAGWHERLVVVVGLAKAFGSMGGVIATPDGELADLIELTGPPLTFSGPIPPPTLGASIAAADIFLSDELPVIQSELMRRIDLVNTMSTEMSIGLTDKSRTPLWFLDLGTLDKTMELFVAMRDAGFFLNAAGFPAVPLRHAGLRFTVTTQNPVSQIEDMLTCLREKQLEIAGDTEIEIDLTKVAASARQSNMPGSKGPES